MDIERTQNYYDVEEVDKNALRRVLCAVAAVCPTVGYVQGMNYIVSFLLTKCGDEEAFLLMYRLITNKRYSLNALLKEGLPYVEVLKKQFYASLKSTDISLYNYFKTNNIDIVMSICLKQWITLYTQTFVITDSERDKLWDLFFTQGWIPIVRLSVLILTRHRDEIFSCESDHALESIYSIFNPEEHLENTYIADLHLVSMPVNFEKMWNEVIEAVKM